MRHAGSISRRRFIADGLALGAAGVTLAGWSPLPASAGDTGPWQIGCYTRPWDNYEYRVALDAIAQAGFRFAGLMTTRSDTRLVISASTTIEQGARVGDEVKKRGLSVLSVYGGGIAVSKSLEAGIADMRRLIDNCAACESASLLMGGIGDENLYDRYYKAIAECCDYAAEKRVHIVVKPHGGLNATGPQCRKAVDLVGHKNFRIWYDPGNIYYYSDGKLDPVTDAATVDGLVTGMCVKDYVHPKQVMVTPGTGQVDFAGVLRRLIEGGFHGGPLVVECLSRGQADATLSEAGKARLFVQELTAKPTRGLQAGVARVDITPPVGYRMSGYFRERLSTGVKNRLYAKALVLQHGSVRSAMVFCDVIGISPAVSASARSQAEQATGIPANNILIAATHTHTGPLYFGALREHFHKVTIDKHGRDVHEEVDYGVELAEKIARGIREANEALQPTEMTAGTTSQEGLSFNRRFHMKDGSVRFNPGVLNPDIVRVAGPIDPDVGIVLLNRPGKTKPFAGLVSFALHLDTVGGTEYGADYPYFLEQSLRETFGKDFLLLFGTGTCGDLNHIDVTKKERLKTEQIGTVLGETVTAAEESLRDAEPHIGVRREVVHVPLKRYGKEEIAQARERIVKVGTRDLSFLEQVQAYTILTREMRPGDTIGLEVQVFRLSDSVAVVGLPGEVFVDLGLAIKKASPFENTLVIELCNDAPGYIPTEKAFAEGSYETVNSRIAPGGGEKMAQAAIRLLKALKPRSVRSTSG